jgi:mono/diheme cytochrome c family protein
VHDADLIECACAAPFHISIHPAIGKESRMRKFFLGVIVTLAGLAGGSYLYLRLGHLDFRADVRPSALESHQAMAFLDTSAGWRAPHQKNPIAPMEANLIRGVRLYKTHCVACHGAPDHPEKNFAQPFYPPAPQFMEEAPDMPENQNCYIIQHGIRWTGMPAWRNTLSSEEIWTVVAFLARMDKLPPAVENEWQKPGIPRGEDPGSNTEKPLGVSPQRKTGGEKHE